LASDVGSGNPQFSGLGDCLAKTMKQGGFFSMYAGFGVSVVGIVAYRGPYFGIYDTLKQVNPYKNDRGATGLFSTFVIAQTTAIIAGVLAYPFGLVVSRFVVANAPGVAERGKHVTIGETYRSLVDGHGVVRGLWRGWPSQITCTFASGLMLVAYDEVKALLHG